MAVFSQKVLLGD